MAAAGRILTSLAVVLSGAVTVAAVWTGLRAQRVKAERVDCGDQLRRVAFAAVCYADDQRFLPFAGAAMSRPSGGIESTASIRITRTLVSRGYLDEGGLICPSSADGVPEGGRTWLAARPGAPMLERLDDPTLAEVRDLSYGWTRRARSANTRCIVPLVADRAVRPDGGAPDPGGDPLQGNHAGGLNVATSDASVEWIARDDPEVAHLLDEPSGQAGLGIADPRRPLAVRPLEQRWTFVVGEWLLLLPFSVAGLALLLRAAPPGPPPARGLVPVRPSAVVTVDRVTLSAVPTATLPLHAGQRCPWCHGGLAPAQPLTMCPACRTTFHAECAAPGARCTTLGCRSI